MPFALLQTHVQLRADHMHAMLYIEYIILEIITAWVLLARYNNNIRVLTILQ